MVYTTYWQLQPQVTNDDIISLKLYFRVLFWHAYINNTWKNLVAVAQWSLLCLQWIHRCSSPSLFSLQRQVPTVAWRYESWSSGENPSSIFWFIWEFWRHFILDYKWEACSKRCRWLEWFLWEEVVVRLLGLCRGRSWLPRTIKSYETLLWGHRLFLISSILSGVGFRSFFGCQKYNLNFLGFC